MDKLSNLVIQIAIGSPVNLFSAKNFINYSSMRSNLAFKKMDWFGILHFTLDAHLILLPLNGSFV